MNALLLIPLAFFAIIFIVTLIEFLTGAEREGLKFFIFIFIFLLLISFLFTLKASEETLIEKFAKLIADLLQNFREIR